jgi:hypothetical protein
MSRLWSKIIRFLWWALYPPVGQGARELIALMLLGIGVSRVMRWGGMPVHYISSQTYGVMLCACAFTLLATLSHRTHLAGRAAAVFGVFLTATLAADTWPMVTSFLLYSAMCYTLIGEAGIVGSNYDVR